MTEKNLQPGNGKMPEEKEERHLDGGGQRVVDEETTNRHFQRSRRKENGTAEPGDESGEKDDLLSMVLEPAATPVDPVSRHQTIKPPVPDHPMPKSPARRIGNEISGQDTEDAYGQSGDGVGHIPLHEIPGGEQGHHLGYRHAHRGKKKQEVDPGIEEQGAQILEQVEEG